MSSAMDVSEGAAAAVSRRKGSAQRRLSRDAHSAAESADDAQSESGAVAALEPSSASSASASLIPASHPSCLFTEGYPYSVRVLHDRLSVLYVQKAMHALDVGTVRSNRPIPKPRETPLWYCEMEVVSLGEKSQISIGIAPLQSACMFAPDNMHASETPVPSQASLRQHDTVSLTCRQVGTDNLSYAYRGDEGKKYHGWPAAAGRPSLAGAAYGPAWAAGDVIGCGVNYFDSSVFFTRNGRNLGIAFTLSPDEWSKYEHNKERADPSIDASLNFYAAVSLHSKGEHVRLNFGQTPFVFDVASFRASEQHRASSALAAARIPSAATLPLIRSFLLHMGYTNTLDALNETSSGVSVSKATTNAEDDSAMKDEAESKSSAASASASSVSAASASASVAHASRHDTIAAQTLSQRRSIRDLIESGDIDGAISSLLALAPALFTTPTLHMLSAPHTMLVLQFRLHSLQFVRILTGASVTRSIDAINFARHEFARYQRDGDDALRAAVAELMGLLALADVSTSSLARTLQQAAYREQLAAEVNSAVLACLCAPADAVSSVHGVSSLELIMRHSVATERVFQERGFPIAIPSATEAMAAPSKH